MELNASNGSLEIPTYVWVAVAALIGAIVALVNAVTAILQEWWRSKKNLEVAAKLSDENRRTANSLQVAADNRKADIDAKLQNVAAKVEEVHQTTTRLGDEIASTRSDLTGGRK